MEELGYVNNDPIYYHCMILGTDLELGLRALGNDMDVQGLASEPETLPANVNASEPENVAAFVNTKLFSMNYEFDPFEDNMTASMNEQPSFSEQPIFKEKPTFIGSERDREENLKPIETLVKDEQEYETMDEDGDDSGSDEDDSDYIVDEDNNLEELNVDMNDYHFNINADVEWVRHIRRGQKMDHAPFPSELDVENPDIPISALQDELQKKYELDVSRMKAFKAKSAAINQVKGDYRQQYSMLMDYCLKLRRANPNTTIKIEVERDSDPELQIRVFKRIYLCLGPLKKGFKAGGRDLLGLDGAFIRHMPLWKKKQLVLGLGFWSVWEMILECLGYLTSLLKVIGRRFCLRHIYENMKHKWNDQGYKDPLCRCATATTVSYFDKAMEELKSFNSDAFEWLSKIHAHTWSRSHFSGKRPSNAANDGNGPGKKKKVATSSSVGEQLPHKRVMLLQEVGQERPHKRVKLVVVEHRRKRTMERMC
nr:hypothetical protein [Tanacetum cinerariifolium]